MSQLPPRPVNTVELIAIIAAAFAQVAVTVMWMQGLV